MFFRGDDYAVPRRLRGIEDGQQGDVVHAALLETKQYHGFMSNVAVRLIESEVENTRDAIMWYGFRENDELSISLI